MPIEEQNELISKERNIERGPEHVESNALNT